MASTVLNSLRKCLITWLILGASSYVQATRDYSTLHWSSSQDHLVGIDPNSQSIHLKVPLPSGCPKAEHIMASSEHLLIACQAADSYFDKLLLATAAKTWTIWVLDKQASQWIKVRGIPHAKPLKWICAFSSANTVAFDVLFKLPQEEFACVRRYWVHTDKELCTWHDLAQGPILDAVVCQSLHASSYRYLFLLERGKVRKLDLIRAREICVPVPEESAQMILRYDASASEDDGTLIILSADSSVELKASTLSP